MAVAARPGQTIRNTLLMLGKCLPSLKKNAVKIQVVRPVFDARLVYHFQEEENYYCQDPTNTVKTGDTVLITQLPQKLTTLITHKVEMVLFRCGDVIDPITKIPCVAWQYREDFDSIIDQYGRLPTSFDYKKAPPRGRLEGTRDLTDKPTYTKWNDDGSNDPYAC